MFSKYGGNLGGLDRVPTEICQTAAEHVSALPVGQGVARVPELADGERHRPHRNGPWYDRNGRLWSANLTNLVGDRPTDADPAIKNDIPNENGVRNQNPAGTGERRQPRDRHRHGKQRQNVHAERLQRLAGGGQTVLRPRRRRQRQHLVRGPRHLLGLDAQHARGLSAHGPLLVHEAQLHARRCRQRHQLDVGLERRWLRARRHAGPDRRRAPGSRKIGAAGGYGGFYCFAVIP